MQKHKFDFAKRLADLVAEADDFDKEMLSPHERRQLELCRDTMTTTAGEFAGDRAGELFGDDAGLDDLRAYRASRIAGTQAAGLAALHTCEQAKALRLRSWAHTQTDDFTLISAAIDGLGMQASELTRETLTRISIELRKIGCNKVGKRLNSACTKYWYTPPPLPRNPEEVYSPRTIVIDQRAAA